MAELSYENLLLVCAVGAIVPLVLGLVGTRRIPSVVVEIGAGIVIGPAVLGWVEADLPVVVLSWLGLTFLLFLAGLEIEPQNLRGPLFRAAGVGYLVSLLLAAPLAFAGAGLGWVEDPALLAIILSATALGLVVPVVKDAGGVSSAFGQAVIVSATVADVGAILLLSVLFGAEGGPGTRGGLLLSFAVVVLVLVAAVGIGSRWARLGRVLASLQETTAQIRVRLAVVLLVGLTALASRLGLEAILGAFVAGVVISVLDREGSQHPHFRPKLEAVGFGVLIPVFYVTTGLQLDVRGLLAEGEALLRVPVFLVLMLAVRGIPALLLRRRLGTRQAAAAGILQATSLPFIVASTQVGLELDLVQPATAAGLVSAGVLSVALFPVLAFTLLRTQGSVPAPDRVRRGVDRATDRDVPA